MESRATWASPAADHPRAGLRFGEAVEAAGAVGDGVVEGAGASDEVADVGPTGESFGSLKAVADGIGISPQAHCGDVCSRCKIEDRRWQGGVGFDPRFGGRLAEADVSGCS